MCVHHRLIQCPPRGAPLAALCVIAHAAGGSDASGVALRTRRLSQSRHTHSLTHPLSHYSTNLATSNKPPPCPSFSPFPAPLDKSLSQHHIQHPATRRHHSQAR